MMDIDTLARYHAAEAHAAVVDAEPPRVSAKTKRPARSRPVWIAAVAATVVVALVLPILIYRLTTDSDPADPTTTVTTATTTTVPGDVFGFASTGRMTLSCLRCSAMRLPDGRVLVVDGRDAALYDPETEAFTPTGPPQSRVVSAGLVALPSGNVLILDRNDPIHHDGYGPVVQIYDTDTGSFRVLEGAQVQGVPVRLDDGRILVVDGVGARYMSADTGEVEPTGGPSDRGRYSRGRMAAGPFVVELLRDGRVLVVGGGPQAEIFDPETGSFTPARPLHGAVDAFTATILTDGRVLLVGGVDKAGATVSSAQVFDPATGAFSPSGSMSFPRSGHTAALLPDGRVLVVGGGTGFYDAARATAEIYDPVTGLFSPAPPPTRARMWATAVSLDDGRVLIVGHHPGNMPTPGPAGADSAEIFSLVRYVQPEGCCAENPSEYLVEVTETLGPDDFSRRQLTVTIPAGALDGAIGTSWGHSLHDAHGGTGGFGETGVPTNCEAGCTRDFQLALDFPLPGASNTWTLTVGFMIAYEGSVPDAAEGITAVIAPVAP